mmetsp:Transcript_32406/g.111589  ORF Transcript_32406/g.111589 Transcript_32406/m.111589 type:complete len:137 (+) Transcript_32406:327-737(+)
MVLSRIAGVKCKAIEYAASLDLIRALDRPLKLSFKPPPRAGPAPHGRRDEGRRRESGSDDERNGRRQKSRRRKRSHDDDDDSRGREKDRHRSHKKKHKSRRDDDGGGGGGGEPDAPGRVEKTRGNSNDEARRSAEK